MRSWLAASFLALVTATPVAALADDDSPAVPRRVTARLDGRMATLTARYLLRFEGPSTGTMLATLELPAGALATRATVRMGSVTQTLALTPADRAQQQFDAVPERKPGPNQRWAMLLSDTSGSLQVELTAPRAGALTLDVELVAPTCFHADMRYVELPPDWQRALAPPLRARASRGDALGPACERDGSIADQLWLGFADPTLARRPGGPDRVGAAAGRLALGGTHVTRVDLELARVLSDTPADLATAIVVDGSRSLTPAQREAQRELVGAYLAAARGSRAQVIAYARTATALLPRWMTATEAAPAADRALAALVARNGSNADVGLAEAGRWLGRAGGTRRVVLVTDELLAARFDRDAARLAALLPAGTLVHVVAIDSLGALEREPDGELATLAAATGGMKVRGGPADDAAADVTMLVRPTSLDEVSFHAPGWTQLATTAARACTDRLVEGDACTWWGTGAPTAGSLTVEGFVWGRRVLRVLAPDVTRAREVARTLPSLDAFDEEEREQAARAARAVNTRWSLYAEWGGPHGYDEGAGIIFGGSICCSHSTASHRIVGRGTGAPLPALDLAPQLAHVARTCDLRGARVEAEIETTRAEIVDVRVTAPAALRACVEEAIWASELVIPNGYGQRTTRVAF